MTRNMPRRVDTSGSRGRTTEKSVFNIDLEKYSKMMKAKMPGTIIKK